MKDALLLIVPLAFSLLSFLGAMLLRKRFRFESICLFIMAALWLSLPGFLSKMQEDLEDAYIDRYLEREQTCLGPPL